MSCYVCIPTARRSRGISSVGQRSQSDNWIFIQIAFAATSTPYVMRAAVKKQHNTLVSFEYSVSPLFFLSSTWFPTRLSFTRLTVAFFYRFFFYYTSGVWSLDIPLVKHHERTPAGTTSRPYRFYNTPMIDYCETRTRDDRIHCGRGARPNRALRPSL